MNQKTFRSLIPGKAVTVGATPVAVGSDHCLPAPRISLIREGDSISSVEVRCGCGQVIILDCIYHEESGYGPKGV